MLALGEGLGWRGGQKIGMRRARLANSSRERWDLTFEGGRFVFQESSITLGERRVQQAV